MHPTLLCFALSILKRFINPSLPLFRRCIRYIRAQDNGIALALCDLPHVVQMRTGRPVVVVGTDARGEMDDDIFLSFAAALQMLRQIFQLGRYFGAAAAAAGDRHVADVFFIGRKSAFALVKGIHAGIPAAAVHDQMTLNDDDELAHIHSSS